MHYPFARTAEGMSLFNNKLACFVNKNVLGCLDNYLVFSRFNTLTPCTQQLHELSSRLTFNLFFFETVSSVFYTFHFLSLLLLLAVQYSCFAHNKFDQWQVTVHCESFTRFFPFPYCSIYSYCLMQDPSLTEIYVVHKRHQLVQISLNVCWPNTWFHHLVS